MNTDQYTDMENTKYTVKDSGSREEFTTGSVRDTRVGKGRFDLIPPYAERLLALHFEAGASKYGDNNWLKGQPLMRYVDSLRRHMNEVLTGKMDEDHMVSVIWNAIALVETREMIRRGILPQELNNIPLGQCWTSQVDETALPRNEEPRNEEPRNEEPRNEEPISKELTDLFNGVCKDEEPDEHIPEEGEPWEMFTMTILIKGFNGETDRSLPKAKLRFFKRFFRDEVTPRLLIDKAYATFQSGQKILLDMLDAFDGENTPESIQHFHDTVRDVLTDNVVEMFRPLIGENFGGSLDCNLLGDIFNKIIDLTILSISKEESQ